MQQLKDVKEKQIQIIREAFELNGFSVLGIRNHNQYLFVYLHEYALNFKDLTRVEKHIKQKFNMLSIKWVGREISLASEFHKKAKVWIQAP